MHIQLEMTERVKLSGNAEKRAGQEAQAAKVGP